MAARSTMHMQPMHLEGSSSAFAGCGTRSALLVLELWGRKQGEILEQLGESGQTAVDKSPQHRPAAQARSSNFCVSQISDTHEVLIHLGCVVVGIVEGGLDVLPPAGALVLNIQVDGGVDTTQAVEQVVTGNLLEHAVGRAGGQAACRLNLGHGLGSQQLQLARGEGGDLLQVDVDLLAVGHHVGACGRNKLHAGHAVVLKVSSPVVDLHAGHDGVVGLLGVDSLGDEVLQVGGDHALGDLGDVNQAHGGGITLLVLDAAGDTALQDAELGLQGVVGTWGGHVLVHTLLLEVKHGLDEGTACGGGAWAVGAADGTDLALAVDGNVGEGEEHVALLALRVQPKGMVGRTSARSRHI